MEYKPQYDYLFKYLLKGSSGAGKTSFLTRYADDTFTELFISTIGIDFRIKTIQSPDTSKVIKLQIWDSIGGRKYSPISSSYRGAHGIIVLFDCTDREHSFNQVPAYFEEINRFANENVQKILVAAKIDLAEKRQVSYEEAKQLADYLGVPYFETSAKNNININEAVLTLTRNMEKAIEKLPKPVPTTVPPQTPSKWSRCIIL